MVEPYSNDLRGRVVAAVQAGESCRSVAARFDVAISSVVKWSQRYQATGSVAPAKMGGYRPFLLEPHRALILDQVQRKPHLTLRGLQDFLAERGISVSHDTVWRFLRRERAELQKTLFALEQGRDDVARRRKRWTALQGQLDPSRLVFIDETWIKTNMAPLPGWGRKGARLPVRTPHGRWRTLTFVGALWVDRVDAPCVFDGPINGECFRA